MAIEEDMMLPVRTILAETESQHGMESLKDDGVRTERYKRDDCAGGLGVVSSRRWVSLMTICSLKLNWKALVVRITEYEMMYVEE